MRKRGEPYVWSDLATYNSEVARGVVHTPEKDAEMVERQRAFDAEAAAELERRNKRVIR